MNKNVHHKAKWNNKRISFSAQKDLEIQQNNT